MRFEQDLNHVG